MANEKHLDIVKQGVAVWNEWRNNNPEMKPDLSMADLRGAQLQEAHLMKVNLKGANLSGAYLNMAYLWETDLSGADLSRAHLVKANLREAILDGSNLSMAEFGFANLSGAYLRRAKLERAILIEANLSGANLNEADIRGANLIRAILIKTSFEKANLTSCLIYGISAWNLKLQGAEQSDLIITPVDEPTITIDNLEVAQFIYLLLNNENIRNVIDTITSKAVLILGRFTPERKAILDSIKNELRNHNYLPILFDFEKSKNKDFTETIMTLAGMCRFIIVDITNPKSSPLELQATIPSYMIPFVPIIQEGEEPFSMFKDLANKYEWILDTLIYDSINNLVIKFEDAVIKPALKKQDELMKKKAEELRTRHINDY